MRIDPLPDELMALEGRLANRPRIDPEASLRGRVLQGVRVARLTATRSTRLAPQNGRWLVAAAFALLAINLSFVVASQPSPTTRYSSAVQLIAADRQALRSLDLFPEGVDR
jgi:hypothetical protein